MPTSIYQQALSLDPLYLQEPSLLPKTDKSVGKEIHNQGAEFQ